MSKKTLWISDLDGTLLTKEKKITSYTKEVLNKVLEQGVAFSVATARTPATVVEMLEGIKLDVPIVVMNGAAIFNIKTGVYEKVNYLAKEAVEKIKSVLETERQHAFVYGIEDNQLIAYYKTMETAYEQSFYEERKDNPYKIFKAVEEYPTENVAYFVIMAGHEEVKKIYDTLKGEEGISQVFYEDVYHEGIYYLEIYDAEVSKAHAIEVLKESHGYNHMICFGDNYNDLPMFKMADEGYAVENAVEAVKEICTEVIGHHNEDGVARFIEQAVLK